MTTVIIKGLEYTNDAQCNCSPPTDQRPVGPQAAIPPPPLPPVSILDVVSHGMEYPVGQFGSAALAVSPPNFLCPSSLLAGWASEAEKSLTLE